MANLIYTHGRKETNQSGFNYNKMIIIKEAKQVGILYHFTKLNKILQIINSNGLKSDMYPYISFTRSFDITRQYGDFTRASVRLVFDGNKLSNKFKIESFNNYVSTNKNRIEAEERISWPNKKILPCMFSLLEIDILKSSIYSDYEKIIIENIINKDLKVNLVDSFKPYKK